MAETKNVTTSVAPSSGGFTIDEIAGSPDTSDSQSTSIEPPTETPTLSDTSSTEPTGGFTIEEIAGEDSEAKQQPSTTTPPGGFTIEEIAAKGRDLTGTKSGESIREMAQDLSLEELREVQAAVQPEKAPGQGALAESIGDLADPSIRTEQPTEDPQYRQQAMADEAQRLAQGAPQLPGQEPAPDELSIAQEAWRSLKRIPSIAERSAGGILEYAEQQGRESLAGQAYRYLAGEDAPTPADLLYEGVQAVRGQPTGDGFTDVGETMIREAQQRMQAEGYQPSAEVQEQPLSESILDPNFYAARLPEQALNLGLQVGAAGLTRGASLPARLAAFAAPEALIEGGNAFAETKRALQEQGASEEEARAGAAKATELTALASGALNTLPGAALLARRVEGGAPRFVSSFVNALQRRATTRTAATSAGEAVQEAAQEASADLAQFSQTRNPEAFRDAWERYGEAGVLGGVLGGGLGAAAGVAQGRRTATDQTPIDVNQATREQLEQQTGLPPETIEDLMERRPFAGPQDLLQRVPRANLMARRDARRLRIGETPAQVEKETQDGQARTQAPQPATEAQQQVQAPDAQRQEGRAPTGQQAQQAEPAQAAEVGIPSVQELAGMSDAQVRQTARDLGMADVEGESRQGLIARIGDLRQQVVEAQGGTQAVTERTDDQPQRPSAAEVAPLEPAEQRVPDLEGSRSRAERSVQRLLGDDDFGIQVADDTTPFESQLAREAKQRFGTDVVYFRPTKQLDEAPPAITDTAADSRTVFIEQGQPEQEASALFHHEWVHDLRRANPQAYNELVTRLRQEAPQVLRRARRQAEAQGEQARAEEEAVAEIAQDLSPTLASRLDESRLRQIAQENPTLWQRIKDSVNRVARKLTGGLVGRQQTQAEQTRERSEMANAALRFRETLRQVEEQTQQERQDAQQIFSPEALYADVRQQQRAQEGEGRLPAQEGRQGVREGRQAEEEAQVDLPQRRAELEQMGRVPLLKMARQRGLPVNRATTKAQAIEQIIGQEAGEQVQQAAEQQTAEPGPEGETAFARRRQIRQPVFDPATFDKTVKQVMRESGASPARGEQAVISERQALRTTMRRQRQAAQQAFRAGREEGVAATKARLEARMNEIKQRRRFQQQQVNDIINLIQREVPKDIRGEFLPEIRQANQAKQLKPLFSALKKIDKQLEKRRHTEALNRLKKEVQSLGRLRPEYQEQAESVTEQVDLKNLSNKKRRQLESLQQYLQNPENGSNIPEATLQQLDRLWKSQPDELTADQLDEFTNAIRHYKHLNATKNKLIGQRQARYISQTANTITEEVKQSRSELRVRPEVPKNLQQLLGKQERREQRKKPRLAGRYFNDASLRPEDLMQVMSPTMRQSIYEQIGIEGNRQELRFWQEAVDNVDAMLQQHDMGLNRDNDVRALNRWREEMVSIPHKNGSIRMTRGEAAHLLANIKAPDNRQRILRDGYTLDRDGQAVERLKFTAENLDTIEQNLGQVEHDIVDTIMDLYNNKYKRELNDTWAKVYGYSIAQVPDYYPINVDRSRVDSGAPQETLMNQFGQQMLEGQGIFKERKGSNVELRGGDIFDAFAKHTNAVGKTVAYLPGYRNAHQLIGNAKVKQAIIDRYGERRLQTLMDAINEQAVGFQEKKNAADQIGSWLRRNAGRSILGLRLSTIMIQPASMFITQGRMRNWRNLSSSVHEGIANYSSIRDRAREHSPEWRDRYEHFFQNATAGVTGSGRETFQPRPIVEYGLEPLQAYDKLMGAIRWRAAEKEVSEFFPHLEEGSDAYYEQVATEWAKMINRSESTSSPMEMNRWIALGRKRPFFGMLSMFQSAASKVYASGRMGVNEIAKGNTSAGSKMLLGAALSSAFVMSMRQLMDEMLYEEEEERSTWLGDMINEISGTMPMMGHFVRPLVSSYEYGTPFGERPETPFSDLFQSSVRTITNTADGVSAYVNQEYTAEGTPKATEELQDVATEASKVIGLITGMPVESVMQNVEMARRLGGLTEERKEKILNRIQSRIKEEEQTSDLPARRQIYGGAKHDVYERFADGMERMKQINGRYPSVRDVIDLIESRTRDLRELKQKPYRKHWTEEQKQWINDLLKEAQRSKRRASDMWTRFHNERASDNE